MDSEDEDVLLFSAACLVLRSVEEIRKKRKHRWWVRNFLSKRESHGANNSLMNNLRIEDRSGFSNYVRLSPQEFEILLTMIAPSISKKCTRFRDAISPMDQLAVTLRFLATGDSYATLMYLHRISKSSISRIIPNVCEAIIKALQHELKMPNTQEDWMKIAQHFNTRWNIPHCIRALDGKHIQIMQPANSGSTFYNYKQTFSIVLLALVDAKYMFTYVNAGIQGRFSDGGVFTHTTLYRKLNDNSLKIPPPTPLPGRLNNALYVIVADDAFPLSETLMKPFPGMHPKYSRERIFNYRLSRARRIVENVFGILSAVFRIFLKPIPLSPEKTTSVVLACVHLHNYLRSNKERRQLYTPLGTFDGENLESGAITPGSWRQVNTNGIPFIPMERTGGRTNHAAQDIREEFSNYFVSEEGRVEWQDNY